MRHLCRSAAKDVAILLATVACTDINGGHILHTSTRYTQNTGIKLFLLEILRRYYATLRELLDHNRSSFLLSSLRQDSEELFARINKKREKIATT